MNDEKQLAETIEALMREHGFTGIARADGLFFATENIVINSRINFQEAIKDRIMMQIDIRITLIHYNREIRESFVGVGADTKAALGNAIENFWRSTLHVILCAFFGYTKSELQIEEWQIAGKKWQVIFGDMVSRGTTRELLPTVQKLVSDIQNRIERDGLPEPVSWLRIFLGNTVKEIALNNNAWPHAQELLSHCVWPQTTEYYSARLFIVFREICSISLPANFQH